MKYHWTTTQKDACIYRLMYRIAAVCMLIVCISLLAFGGRGDKAGASAAAELLIPVGPRSIALGGSSLSTITGIEALYWNPAGLARSPRGANAMFTHMNYIADVGVEYLALSNYFPGFGTIGFSLKALSFGDIQITTEDQPDGTGEIASPTFVTIGATFSRQLADRISVGVTMNLITERMERVSASGIAFNVGVQYNGIGGINGLSLGVVVKNIGPQIAYDGNGLLRTGNIDDVLRPGSFYAIKAASAELPSVMEMGIGYEAVLNDASKVRFSGLFQNNNFSNDEYKTGVEYTYNDLFSLRGGYNYVTAQEVGRESIYSDAYGWSFGLGVRTQLSDLDISVDYAYRAVQFFGGNHAIGVILGF
ncbi:MAG: PorV/PorQ family protein [Ignavibacteriae bacterium]|nr:PorV/PorQ family protein [Ignavibacteria bacterium]MBI3363914.1 PorV/PorQ family protein [Ignavibacteriota bacterium]